MAHAWQLQQAKNHFGEIVEEALDKGPQFITHHGNPMVVVMSMTAYRKLVKPKESLLDFFQQSPLAQVPLDLERQITNTLVRN